MNIRKQNTSYTYNFFTTPSKSGDHLQVSCLPHLCSWLSSPRPTVSLCFICLFVWSLCFLWISFSWKPESPGPRELCDSPQKERKSPGYRASCVAAFVNILLCRILEGHWVLCCWSSTPRMNYFCFHLLPLCLGLGHKSCGNGRALTGGPDTILFSHPPHLPSSEECNLCTASAFFPKPQHVRVVALFITFWTISRPMWNPKMPESPLYSKNERTHFHFFKIILLVNLQRNQFGRALLPMMQNPLEFSKNNSVK